MKLTRIALVLVRLMILSLSMGCERETAKPPTDDAGRANTATIDRASPAMVTTGNEVVNSEEHLLNFFHYREIGPTRQGGRIVDFAVPNRSKQPYTFYVAAANGGIWKTTNNGQSFVPLFDEQNVFAMGDIAVAPSEPDTVWAGTGEPNNSTTDPYASYWGDGAYKSTNGGESWTNMGLSDTHQISRIVIHPDDADLIYVAALGHLYSDNAERGVFKTTDGGTTWTQVLQLAHGDRHVGVIDMVMNPANPDVLYAAAYDRAATPWMFRQGGSASGIYKTRPDRPHDLPAESRGTLRQCTVAERFG
jgi:hypothetical protein